MTGLQAFRTCAMMIIEQMFETCKGDGLMWKEGTKIHFDNHEEMVEYWRQKCKEHPLGDADTPEKQIQYFRDIGADAYADDLVRILLGLSAGQPVPRDYRANTARS